MTERELAAAHDYVRGQRAAMALDPTALDRYGDLLKIAERLLDEAIPSLDNRMPRVDWDEGAFLAIVTERTPITLLACDSGCQLVFEPHASRHEWPWSADVKAVRREGAPRINGP